ncbi:integrase [Sphingomonas sp. F9_3S_D5_B_2]
MKLTKRCIEGLEPKPKDYFVWDDELQRFGVRVQPSGKKTFVVQYRVEKRSRRMSLGTFGVLTLDVARGKALRALAMVEAGDDPLDVRVKRQKAITVAELVTRFMAVHIDLNPNLKESTGREYRHALKRYILPALGRLKVTDVTRADVTALHLSMHDRPYQANRTLEVVSKMFNLAEDWGLRPEGTNPRKRVKKYPEKKRERFLSRAELQRVGQVLAEMEAERVEMPSAIAAVRLLMLTGCRLNEVLRLKWKHVLVRDGELRLPDSKTGKKSVQLGDAALAVLRGIPPVPGNQWVITGRGDGAHLTDLQPFWQRVRARAGLNGVRIHDLRHTYASVAAGAGMSLSMIGRLLGHTQVQTTARYAHLAQGTVKDAANNISQLIAKSLVSEMADQPAP